MGDIENQVRFWQRKQLHMRTHPCVRLFCIVDTLTSASVLPGVEDSIDEVPERVVCAGHDRLDNMSSPVFF